MDLLLKYLEGNTFYEIEDWFYNQLGLYSIEDSSYIIAQTLAVVDFLPKQNGWTQEVAGVIKNEEPIFFVIEYLKQEDDIPILVDLNEIEVEEYLDFIDNKQTIKSYIDEHTRNNAPGIRNDILERGTIQSLKGSD